MNSLIKTIQKCVKPYPKPCVNLSGIDSTIVLHHLAEKTEEPIYTYTAGFTEQETEFQHTWKVADHYGTKHKEILIEDMLDTFSIILKDFSQPRFNLWPWWLAQQAHEDGRLNCYIGEGADEHFGGYWYKPAQGYLERWSGFFSYVFSTYKTIYDSWGLQLRTPFHPDNLSWVQTYPYYDETQQKRHLRDAYKKILPSFVVDREKLNGRFSYWTMWNREIKPYFPNADPQSEDEIRALLNVWVTREWSRVHEGAQPIEIPVM